ncbi:MAG: hypothetical protein ACI8PZ_005174 [Myxococcota bacterium]|jgi:hypothetical protein
MRWMAVLSVLAFVACGGDKDPDPSDSGASTTTPTGTGGGTTSTGSTTTVPAEPGGLAVAFIPFTLVDGANTQDVKLFDMGDGHMLTADRQSIEVATGLTLDVSLDDIEPPLFIDPVDWIDAIQVPVADMPPIELNGTVLDLWYMGPFDFHSPGGVPVSIANTYGVDATLGTVELWVGSYESSAWEFVGTASDDGGGNLVFSGDLGLISTIVLIDSLGESNPPPLGPTAGSATFTGTVSGPDGAYEGARVQYCRGSNCLTARTDAAGEFSISDDVEPGIGSFEIIP